jgi:hypothetical protein
LRKRRISKWPPELNKYFAGRIACINPDADEPGRRFAQEIARNLHGVAKEVRIVEIPGLKDGEDVKEFFERGGTPDELRRLGDDAPLWVPGEKSQSSGLESAAASTYVMRGIRWFWNNRFAIGKLGLLGGLPDQGKGQILSFMIAKATTGGEWPCKEGRAIKGSVLLLTAEDDSEGTIIPRLVAAGADLMAFPTPAARRRDPTPPRCDVGSWPTAEMTAVRRGVRLLGSSCDRRPRSAAAVFAEQTNQGQLLRPRGRRVQNWVTLAISAGNPVIAP